VNGTGRVVVVGASAAGLTAAETLRREGFTGPITMVGAERHLPYDRPPLSKQVLAGTWEPGRTALRREADLNGLGAEWRLGVPAAGLDLDAREVVLADDTRLGFEGLVIATGVRARELPAARGVRGVHVLRTLDDALLVAHGPEPRSR
jgi:3-phenylpropionate/trans-cinnamate dioxygenase ferredoxin reductase subunit